MKRAALVLVTTALSAAVAAPAEALIVKPDTAPLLDSDGVDSGCDATVSGGGQAPDPYVGTALEGAPGHIRIQHDWSCTHHWRAQTETMRWQTVVDGKRGTKFPLGTGKSWMQDDQTPSPEPYSASLPATISPCLTRTDGLIYFPGRSRLGWLLPLGDNSVILGAMVKVNEYKSDLHPYTSDTEKLVTVRCTKARAAYR